LDSGTDDWAGVGAVPEIPVAGIFVGNPNRTASGTAGAAALTGADDTAANAKINATQIAAIAPLKRLCCFAQIMAAACARTMAKARQTHKIGHDAAPRIGVHARP
jgi:hypothetical protein